LLFVPKPLGVDLSKVLNKQAVLADALLHVAEDAKAFRVNAEVGIVLSFQTFDGFENHSRKFFFHIGKLEGVGFVVPEDQLLFIKLYVKRSLIVRSFAVDDRLKSLADVEAIYALLLHCEHEAVLKKLAVKESWDVFWSKSAQVDGSVHIHSPSGPLLDILSQTKLLL